MTALPDDVGAKWGLATFVVGLVTVALSGWYVASEGVFDFVVHSVLVGLGVGVVLCVVFAVYLYSFDSETTEVNQ